MKHTQAIQLINQRIYSTKEKRTSVSASPNSRPLTPIDENELATLRLSIQREMEKRYAGCVMLIKDPKFLYLLGADLAPEPRFLLGQELLEVFGQEILLALCRARIYAEMGETWSVERFTDEYISLRRLSRAGFPSWCTSSSE